MPRSGNICHAANLLRIVLAGEASFGNCFLVNIVLYSVIYREFPVLFGYPGDQGVVNCTLQYQMALTVGLKFTMREMYSTIATGIITKLLPSVEVPKKRLAKVDFARVIKSR